MIITIDGPAGTGKSSVAREVAKKLSFVLLDTGALYRTVAYALLSHAIDIRDQNAVVAFLNDNPLDILSQGQSMRYVIGGVDATDHIRAPEVGTASSIISAHPAVRAFLLPIQRSFGFHQHIVCEGRDVGTTVFPEADVKIFLTARPDVRAERRYLELKDKRAITLEEVQKEIEDRDLRDSTRKASPLVQPKDAVVIDTSDLTLAQVVERVTSLAQGYPHWEHFPHQSDVGIRGIGSTPAEAFAQAALALTAIIADPASVSPTTPILITLPIRKMDDLFFDFLGRIIYEMDVRRMLFSKFDISASGGTLRVVLYGEPVSVEKHHPAVEVKAATYFSLRVYQRPDRAWCAECVVDV
jgi:CMP/dCMP kinase